MYKKFYLNEDHSFDINGNYRFKGKDIVLNDQFIDIEISGEIVQLDKTWVSLLCHYDVKLPLNELVKIKFMPITSRVLKVRCGMVMYFTNPILYKNGFRIIPGFTNFAINKNGKVISLYKNKDLEMSIRLNPYGYPCVNIRDPDKNRWRPVCTHLLMAKAFIYNSDISNKIYVNHKNGNKLDNRIINLEWVTPRENNNHAFISNLRTDNKRCVIRDYLNNTITEYHSHTAGFKSIGLKFHNRPFKKLINGILIPRLFCKRFEIKDINDTTEWYYTTPEKRNQIIENTNGYEAKNIETGEIIHAEHATTLAKITNTDISMVRKAVYSERQTAIGNFIFRSKSDKEWLDNFYTVKHSVPRNFIITNIKDNEILKFNSSATLRKYLGLDKKTLKNRLHYKMPYNGWIIEELFN